MNATQSVTGRLLLNWAWVIPFVHQRGTKERIVGPETKARKPGSYAHKTQFICEVRQTSHMVLRLPIWRIMLQLGHLQPPKKIQGP